MKIYDFEQQTPEWHEIKELKFTATDCNTLLNLGAGLKTKIEEKLMEYYSSNIYEEYTKKPYTKDMQRGNEFEDQARTVYELETGNRVEQIGFCELNEHVGCSPDGLVNDDGLIEIKNHSDKIFFKLMQDHKIDKKYLDQMQYQMYVTGRKWCDYFGFNPNFNPCYVKIRVNRDNEVQNNITEALKIAIPMLKKRKNELDKLFKKETKGEQYE